MSRQYEIVYIFDSALEETQVNEHLERFHALLKAPEFPTPVTSVSHWGKRQLAYAIKGKELGHYAVAQFETDPKLLQEFERAIKLEDTVLRHLIVINEGLAATPVDREEKESRPAGDDESRPAGDKESRPAGDKESRPAGDEESRPADDKESRPAGDE